MLTDFSARNLTKLAEEREEFLLQCPKTKLVRRMRVRLFTDNSYLVETKYEPNCTKFFVKRKSRYYGGVLITSAMVLEHMLKHGNFMISK